MVISEPKSAHLREVLLFAFNWKKGATEAHRMLEEVHVDHTLSKSQCYRWFKKFQSGDFELDNEPRGKPHQKFEDAELQALLDDDSTQTQEKLAKQLQVSHELSERQQERCLVTCEGLLARHEKKSFLHRIVTSDEKSIHFSNPMRQRSWGLLGQFPKRKPRPNRLGKKAMLCVWWDQTGVVYFKLLKPGETVNTSRYEQQMHSLREALNEKRPELREKHNKLILQHDNAPAHNATVISRRFGIEECNIVQTPGDQKFDEYKDSKPVDKTFCQEMIGSLMYLATGTRPDISYNFKKKNQSFDDFVTKVKNKAVDCDFGDLTESLIRDRIVLGVLDKNLTERYLQDPDLTLSKAIALGRAAESSRTQLKEIKEEITVDKLSSYKETSSNKNTEHKLVKKNHKLFKACGKCASKHEYGNCPAYEEVLALIQKANIYSVLDAKYAFWQIPLTDEASLLTTMSTPYGRYCYTRMPYGLSSAPENFQRIIHQLYLGVPNVVTYMDDVLIYSDSETEHLKIPGQVLEIARENGLKFDKTKTQLMQPSVRYLGHIVSTEGIRPLESKVKAILDMPRPQDKKALQRFLGMVTYLAKFLPNLSDKTANMRLLLRKNELWVWNDLRDRDYRDLKLQLMSAPCLRHFDPKLDIEISTDASSNGLGAVLQQQRVPITYSSTALSAAQKKYSQIEEELLPVYFGCKRNHLYLYGRKFTAFIDHKPLLTIMKKPMVDLSPRLQRLVLQLQHYDFDFEYIPGKKLYTADALSRDYIANDLFTTPEIEISQITKFLLLLILITVTKILLKQVITTLYCKRSTKVEMVIEKLKEVFARCGVPEIMMTDNGPPFQSTEMMEFAKEWNVTHTTSSPRFPQSNGMIERTIQTLKSTIIKCQQSKQDIYQALLLLRNTEHNSLPSPAIMLYGRKQRLFLPMKTTLMNESRICEDSIRKQHEANQGRMKFYFNRHARDLPSLENGQSVLVRQEKQWSPAEVIAPGVHPRSYLLEDTKGSVLRRNRRDLRPADTLSGPTEKESPPEKQEQLDPQPSTSSQSEETSATTRTRCGRLVKPPVRLNL
ncbi:hypothetical protein LAZ67_3003920 [Cordylochernes scorpioides]|uniref:Uncharacterized protein n=1 Tax=Cordylochernes scorpioides TaxID=51811 RepID=A0ABY6KC50_9ARAC|nr:hypothetical protein LAZ67_3003920 [Cordylochernes scorpioides]